MISIGEVEEEEDAMAESITISINYLLSSILLANAHARFSLLFSRQRNDLNELNCCVSMREADRNILVEFWTVVTPSIDPHFFRVMTTMKTGAEEEKEEKKNWRKSNV